MIELTIDQKFDLLIKLIRKSGNEKGSIDLTELEKLITLDIPEALKKNAPYNFPELLFDFQQEFNRFKEFVLYDKLIGKNVVALGGGFSSGKSSFLNSIIGERLLPTNIDPTTSVPAYIVYGEENEALAINAFQSKIRLDIEDIRKIDHSFGGDDLDISLGQLVNSMFISCQSQKFKNIALLDTPGYNGDNKNISDQTDNKIARTQLNSSNYILWCIPARDGTVCEPDIKFLKSLNPEIPKMIILTKADQDLSECDFENIIDHMRKTLIKNGIAFEDILLFSRKINSCENKRIYPKLLEDRNKIVQKLEEWDNSEKESRFAYNFKILFSKCREYYDDRIADESKQLSYLNRIDIMAKEALKDGATLDYIDRLVKNTQNSVRELKERKENLKVLQNTFFTQIKQIADMVNISMPEPSEIDLIKDKISDPLIILENYCESDDPGRKKRNELFDILESSFGDIKPASSYSSGASGNISATADMLMEILSGID